MDIKILASGSSGNCIAIKVDDNCILIDAGIPKTKIENALINNGILPIEVHAVFITHAHNDHIKGLPFANKYNIPVYAGGGEWDSIVNVFPELKNEIKDTVDFNGYSVTAFGTHHDAYDPKGYIVHGDKKIAICLDTGKIDREMLQVMKDSDVYILEANHDPEILQASNYPESVKARILSDIGHLSNQQCANALKQLIKGRSEHIYLLHLSSNNNMPNLAKMTVVRELKKIGYVVDKHYTIEVL